MLGHRGFVISFGLSLLLVGCASETVVDGALPDAQETDVNYIIGPGDNLSIFVWQNPELTTTVQVRPDGRISIPLVQDMQSVGKTPSQLAGDLETALSEYVRSPNVTVMVQGFGVGAFGNQIRVLGTGAARPQAVSYRDGLTLIDVMIEVGLTEFAAGNRATLLRRVDGQVRQTRVRLEDLLSRGDLDANVSLLPGDVLIIPETRF
jgi:polysaccharide export outer membrane protein